MPEINRQHHFLRIKETEKMMMMMMMSTFYERCTELCTSMSDKSDIRTSMLMNEVIIIT